MSKEQAKVYKEMKSEIDARRQMLLREKEQLSKAPARIVAIDAELAVLDSEDSEYDDAINKLPKDATK